MNRTAIIFDLDGTLADTLGDIADVANETMARFGGEHRDDAAWNRLVGHGARFLIEGALPKADAATVDAATADFRRRYAARPCRRTRPYPGVPELLLELAGRDLPLAVLSNKPQELADAVLAVHFADAGFYEARGAREGVALKPDPAVALEIAAAGSVTAGACLFVGDTAVDIETALNAGMTAVGAAWGFRGREELAGAGAHHVIDRPGELLGLLGDD